MRHDQLPFISWRGLKSETTIERLDFGIDGVRQQCPDARLFGDRKGVADGILQHAETWTLPLVVEIDGKPRKNHQRNRVLSHAAADPLGRFECVDLADRQTEVASNPLPSAYDKGSCRAAALGLACVAMQPIAESRLSAVKRFQAVLRIEWLRCAKLHFSEALSNFVAANVGEHGDYENVSDVHARSDPP